MDFANKKEADETDEALRGFDQAKRVLSLYIIQAGRLSEMPEAFSFPGQATFLARGKTRTHGPAAWFVYGYIVLDFID